MASACSTVMYGPARSNSCRSGCRPASASRARDQGHPTSTRAASPRRHERVGACRSPAVRRAGTRGSAGATRPATARRRSLGRRCRPTDRWSVRRWRPPYPAKKQAAPSADQPKPLVTQGHPSAESPPSDLGEGLPSRPITHIARRSQSFGGRCPFATFTPKRSGHNPLVLWLPHHLADRPSDRPESLSSRRTAEPRPPTTFFCGSLPGGCPSAEASGLLPFTFRLDRCGSGTFDQRASNVKRSARDPQGYPRTFFVVPMQPTFVHRLATGKAQPLSRSSGTSWCRPTASHSSTTCRSRGSHQSTV